MIKLFKWSSSVILLSLASVAAQAGLILSDDMTEVTGVSDILINGELRTFDFIDGKFNDLLGGVGYSFNTFDAATEIVGMFAGGPFARSPVSIRGCELDNFCYVRLPRAGRGVRFVSQRALFVNDADPQTFGLSSSPKGFNSGFDPGSVFAVLRPTAVPEPSTMGLVGLSLLALGCARKFKTKHNHPKLV